MKLIGYVRVSTAKQGESGLGLEAQLKAIDLYAAGNDGELVQVYREVESGTNSARPELAKAIKHAKRIGARLVIAKLDRLARNVHLVSGLMQSGVDFIATDNPHANKLTVHIMAAMGEYEADAISQRTTAALAAAKARGVLLGSARPGHWKGREAARLEGAAKASQVAKAKRDAEAEPVYREVLPTIQRLRDEGECLQTIADHLNAEGFSTVRGLAWNRMQVMRLVNSAIATVAVAGVMHIAL